MAYTTVGSLRDRLGSCGEGYSDQELQSLVDLHTNYIDMVTGLWFESRDLVFKIDGTGTETLLVPEPIVSISKVERLDQFFQPSSEEIELESLAVYNRHLTQGLSFPDDRKNPKISFVSTPLGVQRFGLSATVFYEQNQNYQLTGKFGFTEPDYEAARSIASDAGDAITALDAIEMTNGSFTQEDVGRTISIAGSASNDGDYVIATVVDGENVTTVEQTLTTEGTGFTATMSAFPQWGRTPIAIRDVCEKLCVRDLPAVPGAGMGGPHDPLWYEKWMRSMGRVLKEKVRDQEIQFMAPGGSGGNFAGVITGDPQIDLVLLMHSRSNIMRAV